MHAALETDDDSFWELDLRPCILLVDDEVSVVQALQRHLRKDFRVISASSGQYAIELLQARLDFVAVMTDYHMPQVSGLEVLAAARQTHPSAARVLFTGSPDAQLASGEGDPDEGQIVLLKPLAANRVASYLHYVVAAAKR